MIYQKKNWCFGDTSFDISEGTGKYQIVYPKSEFTPIQMIYLKEKLFPEISNISFE